MLPHQELLGGHAGHICQTPACSRLTGGILSAHCVLKRRSTAIISGLAPGVMVDLRRGMRAGAVRATGDSHATVCVLG